MLGVRCVAGGLPGAGRRVGGLGGDPVGFDTGHAIASAWSDRLRRTFHNRVEPIRIASIIACPVLLAIPTAPSTALAEPNR
jgi:hypothetical protein